MQSTRGINNHRRLIRRRTAIAKLKKYSTDTCAKNAARAS